MAITVMTHVLRLGDGSVVKRACCTSMATWVWISNIHIKDRASCVCNSELWGRDRRIPGAHWQANQPSRNGELRIGWAITSHGNKMGSDRAGHLASSYDLCALTGMCIHRHVHICLYSTCIYGFTHHPKIKWKPCSWQGSCLVSIV